jgi:hypothetical protein
MDASYTFVTEDEYNAIRLETNLEHLHQDINLVNDELEQIKKLLFQREEDYEEQYSDYNQ